MEDDEISKPSGLRERASTVQPQAQARLPQSWRRQTTAPLAGRRDDSPKKKLEELEKFDHDLGAPLLPLEEAASDVGEEPQSLSKIKDEEAPPEPKDRVPKTRTRQPFGIVVNFILCLVTLSVGLLMPTMVDMSRTATQYEPGGIRGPRCLPYMTASVVTAEALVNVLIGAAAILFSPKQLRSGQGGLQELRELLCWRNHKDFVWLTLTYCLGDMVALCAIGRGGGLIFLSMSNARLLFAAIASHCYHRWKSSPDEGQPRCVHSSCIRECLILAAMSASLVCFAVSTSSSQEAELRRGTLTGSGLALLKAGLSSVAAVLQEHTLKHGKYDVWQANTLLKMQSLLVAMLLAMVQFGSREELCPEDKSKVTIPCIDKRGWDPFTACVLFAEVGNGWLSVAILKRMSAVVKFVCKSAAAPSLYMVYSFSHFRQHHFEWQTFLPILAMTTCIYLYAEPPCFGSVGSAKGHQNHQNTQTWPDQYKAKRGQSAQG